jgi:polar amino acid transport system substrate-binding protein
MSRSRAALSIVALLLLSLQSLAVFADDKVVQIRAVVASVPPFVMEEKGQLTGFSVDLWNEVAARLNLKTTYRVAPNVDAMGTALRNKEADVVVSAVFFTAERDREFDFPYPILNAGLQVMVPDTGQSGSASPLEAFLEILFSRSMAYWLVAALVLIVVPANVIWLLERRTSDSVSQSDKYFPGIFHAMVWAAESMVSQAQEMPRHRIARVLGIVWLFTGVVFVAFFTAQLTSDLTVQQIRGSINGPEDLPGKEIGTIAGSPGDTYGRSIGAHVHGFNQLDDLYAALLHKQVDAVVLGAPALKYFASHGGAGQVRIVGPEFKKGDLGFVVQMDSPLRKEISTTLLAMKEDGTYRRIYEKWFGGKE